MRIKTDRRLTMGKRTTRLREILQQSGEASVSEIAAKLAIANEAGIGRTALACQGTLQEMAGWITDKGIKHEHVNALKAFRKKMTLV
jgi:DeoR/GlpR family transcriptional regulator of sugar metabolism